VQNQGGKKGVQSATTWGVPPENMAKENSKGKTGERRSFKEGAEKKLESWEN